MFKNLCLLFVKNAKKIICLSLILILFFATFIITANNYKIPALIYSNEKNEVAIPGIWNTTTISQTFTSKKSNFSAFSLRFGTYMRICDGSVTVSLYDITDEKKLIFSETIPAADIADNQFKPFHFDRIRNSKDKLYLVEVTASDVVDKPLTLWCSNKKLSADTALYIDNTETAYELNLILYNNTFFSFENIVTIIFSLCIAAFLIFSAIKGIFIFSVKPKAFLAAASIVISSLLLTAAVNVSPGKDPTDLKYSLNAVPLLAFLAILLLTIVLEKRLGFYRKTAEFFKNEISILKQSLLNKNFAFVTVRLLSSLTSLAFLILAFIFIAFAKISFARFITIFILALISTVSNIIYTVKYKSSYHPAKLFLIVAITVCILFSYTLPICASNAWDEQIHYANALNLKNHFYLNTSLTDYRQTFNFYSYFDKVSLQTNLYYLFSDSEISYAFPLSSVNLYTSVAYIPYTLSMLLSDLLGINYFAKIVFAKLSSSLICSFVIYAAIKKLKSGAHIFSSIALLPTCMFLLTSFSCDMWIFAFSSYVFATYFQIISTDKFFSASDCAKISIASLVGFAPKAIYFVFMLPLFFIKKSKCEHPKNHVIYKAVLAFTMLLVLLSFIVPFLINTDTRSDFRGGNDVNAGEQMLFILSNPMKYVKLLFEFFIGFLTINNFNGSITFFAYLGAPDSVFGLVSIIIIICCIFCDKDEDDFKNTLLHRCISVLSLISALILTATALYISFTPLMHYTVNGYQFRYLFPVLAPFFYCIGPTKIKNSYTKGALSMAVFISLFINLMLSYYNVYLTQFSV